MQKILRYAIPSSFWFQGMLAVAIGLIYGQFLDNPIVFDDGNFFDGKAREYLNVPFSIERRWLPYATFEWTRNVFGLEISWFRLGNMMIHIATSIVLFHFLRRLFDAVLPDNRTSETLPQVQSISLPWLAFFAALIFALHPASVYAVGYLIQRTILLATFFTVLMWWLFLEGIVRRKQWPLIASAVTYFFAVFSKEHAIMGPAVSGILLFLLHKPSRHLFARVWPAFLLYGLIGALAIYELKGHQVIGRAYEPNAADMLSKMAQDRSFDPWLAHILSVLTQAFLFFKYLLVWIVPSSAWMSVDMYENFATELWSWPNLVGLVAFIIYPVIAIWMLLQRREKGLFGFAMFCPWILFFTEFAAVRIQESFVIYRSYLWMAGAFAAMPLIFQKVAAKRAIIILTAVAVLMIPLTWVRLTTFSHSLLLWDDAARLVKNKDDRPGVERIYHNRGHALFLAKLYALAEEDLSKAIAINPGNGSSYSVRGTIYLETHRYSEALNDFDKAIKLLPSHQVYLGRARVYEALSNPDAARKDYEASCLKGSAKGCARVKSFSSAQ